MSKMKTRQEEETGKLRYFQPSFEKGIIESVSPEGEKLFAIIRRLTEETIDRDGAKVKVKGALFGNEANLDEEIITLTEVLVPLSDISLDHDIIDPNSLINRKVSVKMVAGHPASAVSTSSENLNPRIISKEQIYEARMQDPEHRLDSKAAIDYLRHRYGFSAKQINALIDETYGKVSPKGFRLSSAGTSAWDQQSEADQSKDKDISNTALHSTNTPATRLRTKTCYYHAKAFSGK